MMKTYQCPYAHRNKKFNGMMCSLLMDESKYTYNNAHECVQALCAFGYYCPNNGRWEINPRGKDCTVKQRKEVNGDG